jgi:hypothetical protein
MLMASDAEAVVKAVVDAAKAGDMTAARLVLDRIAPVRRGAPVRLELPHTDTAQGVAEALAALIAEMSTGAISPEEAALVAGVLEIRRHTIETCELDERIAALEGRK